MAGVFAFYLNYVPIHLATAAHLDAVLESLTELVLHHDDQHTEHHDSDDHVPHPASDHTLTFTTQTPAHHGAVALMVFLLPVDVGVVLFPPTLSLLPLVFERIRPPGESPPEPLQPRAPPFFT